MSSHAVVGVTFVRSDSSSESACTNLTISDLVEQLENQHQDTKLVAKKTIASWNRVQIRELERLVLEYGTDFSTIGLFMGKSRDQVKRKFKVLQKKVPGFGFV